MRILLVIVIFIGAIYTCVLLFTSSKLDGQRGMSASVEDSLDSNRLISELKVPNNKIKINDTLTLHIKEIFHEKTWAYNGHPILEPKSDVPKETQIVIICENDENMSFLFTNKYLFVESIDHIAFTSNFGILCMRYLPDNVKFPKKLFIGDGEPTDKVIVDSVTIMKK